MIRDVSLSDAKRIHEIYNEYVEDSRITFQEKPLSLKEIKDKIQKITKVYPWIVYEKNNQVVGYTYADKWKEKSAYRYTVETSIYLDSGHLGKGIGSKLKGAMIEKLREREFHCVISAISLPNPASIAMCEKFGFQKAGQLREIGYKFDEWIDVGYWQLIL
ncbi:MAG: N-acetyltransferase family protein [Balneolaceae bacterium]|nr:N-acetyltransferase family protein [Balneolaceae bacterium]MDR9407884.1 N-acetyltransferase family protein [Balneolaceae bacterium]